MEYLLMLGTPFVGKLAGNVGTELYANTKDMGLKHIILIIVLIIILLVFKPKEISGYLIFGVYILTFILLYYLISNSQIFQSL